MDAGAKSLLDRRNSPAVALAQSPPSALQHFSDRIDLCARVDCQSCASGVFDWYEYLPLAFLRPAALQIQGTVLALLCLAFLAARFVVRRAMPDPANPTRRLFDTFAVDRLLVWVLVGGFLLLAGYGSLSGVIQELSGVANSRDQRRGISTSRKRMASAHGSCLVYC